MTRRTLAALACCFSLTSCVTLPSGPVETEPDSVRRKVQVDSVTVVKAVDETNRDTVAAFVDVRGQLSGGAAHLLPPKQSRSGFRLHVELFEKTPAGVVGTTALEPFESRIPLDIEGLSPGVYAVEVNGKEAALELLDLGNAPAPR